MTLKLHRLTFDRKTVNGRPAAIPVRAKMTVPAESADWRGSNTSVTAVAYPLSLSAADINNLRITATFTAATPLSAPIFIRAIGAHGRLLGDLVSEPFAPSDVGQPRQFRLSGVLLPQATIDAHTVAWNWQWSVDGTPNSWQPFASSSHPVFVLVDHVKAPWGRGHLAGDPHTVVPWQEVMALACTWGKGLRRVDKVVEAITVAVDKLAGTPIGGDVVKYQNGGNLCYGKKFCINDIPLIVKKNPNATDRLNCQDINTTIAMFSTILGCDVRLIKLLPNNAATIDTNKIKVFGRQNATNEPFEYHEVAARPDLPIDERPVWDACLRVDFDANPAAAPPGDFDLPVSLTMHQTGMDIGYRKRLLASASQNCIITNVESDGLRYPGEVPVDGPATPALDPEYRARRQKFARMMAGVPISGPTPPDLLLRFEQWLAGVAREGFRRRLDTVESVGTVLFTPLSPVVTGGSPMLAEVVMADTGEQAVDVFLTLAAHHAGVLNPVGIGEFGLQDPGRTVLFLRGPIVAFLSDANDEVDPPSNFDAALQLDENLRPIFEAVTPSP